MRTIIKLVTITLIGISFYSCDNIKKSDLQDDKISIIDHFSNDTISKKALFIFAHGDDETACAGTILKLKENNYNVGVIILTNQGKEIRHQEFLHSMKLLDVDYYKHLSLKITNYNSWNEIIENKNEHWKGDTVRIKNKLIEIISDYNPSIVFYTGIAGALTDDLNIGDIVISVDSVQWDVDITAFGFKVGELPSAHVLSVENKTVNNVRFYKANPEILEKALKWNPDGFEIKKGRIITGDSFFTTTMHNAKADLVKALDGYAVDMEGASVGAACGIYNVPFFLARVISDTDKGKKPKRFKQFMKDSSNKMAELIESIINDLP